ncbi:MAG: PH domain-containing protein [Solirubrobacteraceae bacterium]
MTTEPGEQIFFCGHPSWRSMVSYHVRGLVISLLAGVAAGVTARAIHGNVRTGWVILAVLIAFIVTEGPGYVRRVRTTYVVTSRRLTIETGLVFRARHETRLQGIRNVTSRQSIAQRALRVGTVDFDTGWEEPLPVAFHGVSHPRRIAGAVDGALAQLPRRWPPPSIDRRGT